MSGYRNVIRDTNMASEFASSALPARPVPRRQPRRRAFRPGSLRATLPRHHPAARVQGGQRPGAGRSKAGTVDATSAARADLP